MKRSTPTSVSGLTLVELLVALAIAFIVVGAAMTLTFSSRKVYDLDETRTSINQNLRNALTIIGSDVRQTGERLPTAAGSVFPALELVQGGEGPELIVRRSRLATQPTLCASVSGSAATLTIGTNNNPPYPECDTTNSTIRNSLQAQILDLRAYRAAQTALGLPAHAYLYDPIDRVGEFFIIANEQSSRFTYSLSRTTGSWNKTYNVLEKAPAEGQPRIYILEERRYRKQGDYLQVVVNGDTGNPQNLIFGVSGFDVQMRLKDGSRVNAFGAAADWTQIAAVEVSVTGRADVSGRNVQRTFSSEFFPRNALNRVAR